MNDLSFGSSNQECLAFNLLNFHRLLVSRMNSVLKESNFDVTFLQAFMLKTIFNNNGLTVGELCDIEEKDKANVTRMLDSLEKKGYVNRLSDELDKRTIRVYYTKKGKLLSSSMRAVLHRERDRIFEGIENSKIDMCNMLLEQLKEKML